MKVRRLGLFGGTFDPPHFGHVAALRAAARCGRFDQLLVTVAGDPYAKRAVTNLPPAALRLAMAHAAFDDLDLVVVSDLEIRRAGPSYTIDTVREVLTDADEVDLIVGADLAAQLDTWHEATALAQLVGVGVVPRPGSSPRPSRGWRSYVIEMEPVDLSSSYVRATERGDQNLGNFLPAAVIPLFEEARG